MRTLKDRLAAKKRGELVPSEGGPLGSSGRTAPDNKAQIERQVVDYFKGLKLTSMSFPQGRDGADGINGTPGAPGAAGVGVPAGGTALAVLSKNTSADYDTGWMSIATSGSSGLYVPTLMYNDNSVAAMTYNVTTMQAMINTIQANTTIFFRKQYIQLPTADTAYFNAGFSIDCEKCGGIKGQGTILNFSFAPDGIKYFTLTTSNDTAGSHFYAQEMCIFSGLHIVGNSRTGTSVAWDIFTAYIKFIHVFHYTVKTIESHHDNTYMIKHLFCHGRSCGLTLNRPNGSNSGECISYDGCSYGNSDQFLQCDEPDAQINFTNGSLDFLSVAYVIATSGKIYISNSNLEVNAGFNNIWFQLGVGNAGTLTIKDCVCVGPDGGLNDFGGMVSMGTTWRVYIDSPHMENMRNNLDRLVTGAGSFQCKMNNWQTFNTATRSHMFSDDDSCNILGDGMFDNSVAATSNTVTADLWSIIDNVSTFTRTDGVNCDLFVTSTFAPPGQTNCLQVRMNAGIGNVKSIALFMPNLVACTQYVASFQEARDASTTSPYFVSWRWFERMLYNSSSVPFWQGRTLVEPLFNSLSVDPVTTFVNHELPVAGQFTMVCPVWASGAAMVFNFNNNAIGNIFIGDVKVQKWSD